MTLSTRQKQALMDLKKHIKINDTFFFFENMQTIQSLCKIEVNLC